MNPLGIMAAGGDLPRAIAQSVTAAGRAVQILAIRGSASEDWLKDYPHDWISIGEPGRVIKLFKSAGVSQIIMAGKVERPKFSEIKLDAKGVMVLPRVVAAARKGDDALLRAMVDIFQGEGLTTLSVAEAAPGLVADAGPLGKLAPTEDHDKDIAQAFAIVRALGALDVGQAAVVCEGLALAVEAAEGTDAMIARVGSLKDNLRGTIEKKRGVLVKALKPTQDAVTDMPVIGVKTVRNAHAVGLAGIALQAGASLIVGKADVAAEADRLGLFIVGVHP
jgi:hypothetical protein